MSIRAGIYVRVSTDEQRDNGYSIDSQIRMLTEYCEKHNVKIELTLEPYDISTANGEMMFGMNLIFGQRERKEIGARTKRGLEEMAIQHIHPAKAPYEYDRNKETGFLEINEIEISKSLNIFLKRIIS